MTKQKIILLADDHQLIRECYSEMLKMSFPDYNLEIFEDGTSLQKRLEKSIEDVALVSTDNQMPGILGGEIIEKYAQKVPIILVYGGAQHIGERAVESGAVAYLLKPVTLYDFKSVVKMALDNSENFKK